MTDAKRMRDVEIVAEIVIERMDLTTYEAKYAPEDEKDQLAWNREIVGKLIAAARRLGRDYSSVIR